MLSYYAKQWSNFKNNYKRIQISCSLGDINLSKEYEKEEEFMIANSDTIVHPRTVMVHFENAAFADAAVMRSIRFEGFATTADSFGWAGIGFGGFEEFHF